MLDDEEDEDRPKRSPAEVLRLWVERDLTAAARAGDLAPAFEVDSALDQVRAVLDAGRSPVVGGEAGVGKTALVEELVRRSVAGDGPRALEGRQVLQLSLRRRASSLKKPEELGAEFPELIEVLATADPPVLPYFRDLQVAWQFDLETQLQALAFRLGGPILGEGERDVMRRFFEYSPELEQHFTLLQVDEPSLDRTRRILEGWAAVREEQHGEHYEPPALDQAIALSHRFLARGRFPRKAIDLLRQSAATRGGAAVHADDVIARFCRSHRVPPSLVDPTVRLDLDTLEQEFGDRVLGQPDAVNSVVQMIGLVKAGLSDLRRPFGVFLFVGPTGVGKTHLAQLLAEYLFGSPERMIRVNMADFTSEGDHGVLFGRPDAHMLPQRRGVLTNRIMGHPFAVLLLDELEKAHEKVHDQLLQLIDEGCFINGHGEQISCRSTIIIATSNAGAEAWRGRLLGFDARTKGADVEKEVHRRLEATFRLEFLNRFDRIVHFRPLTREHIRAIARRELAALGQRAGMKQRGLQLQIDEGVVDWLTAHGYDPKHGARFLRRILERHVTTAVARAVVQQGPAAGAVIELSVHRGVISADLPRRDEVPARQPLVLGGRTRKLDRAGLLSEAEALVAAARPLLERLETNRTERARLLERIGDAGLSPESGGRPVLERFRELDVAVAGQRRLAGPLRRLGSLLQGDEDAAPPNADLAGLLGQAAEALARWEERLADDCPAAMWVVLSAGDALAGGEEWLGTLVEMELGWARRLGLQAEPVAIQSDHGGLRLVALEVEGPGAGLYMPLEAGVHRLHRADGPDLRVKIEALPLGDAPPAQVESARRGAARFGVKPDFRADVQVTTRGIRVSLCASDRVTLGRLASDLAVAWKGEEPTSPPVVRVYGRDGIGAHDPRTGAQVAKFRDVKKGKLEALLEGWRRAGRMGD